MNQSRHRRKSCQKVNDVFALEKLRPIETSDLTAHESTDPSSFEYKKKHSFLPLMMEMIKDNGLNFVFIRVQRRPLKTGPPPQDPSLLEYITKLKQYLVQNGCGFYDFTGDPDITLGMYLDGDHISPDKKQRYTEIFIDRLAKEFE